MTVKKNDFVELEFTGKIADTGEIFDTNEKENAKILKVKDVKPFVLCVGHLMLPVGFDEDLAGKEIGKRYSVEVLPEKAFGKRNPQMVRMIPTKFFYEQKINPERGMQLALDGQVVKVLSSSGGRTLVDFNNPLAGKKIIYDYQINKIIDDEKEKIDAVQEFLFRRKFEFEKKEGKVIFKIEKQFEPFIKLFGEKFKEILGAEIGCEVKKEEKKEKKDSK